MAISTLLIPFGSWLLGKISDKGFDLIFDKLSTSDHLNLKFNNAVEVVAHKLKTKYPEVLGGSIVRYFKHEDTLNELVKLIFQFSKVDIDVISSRFDTETLPSNFIQEFIEELKIELLKDKEFDEIFANKELFILIESLDSNIEQIERNSNISKNEIISIRRILEQRLGALFSISSFRKHYTESAIRNLSQINFIGLGVDISVKRERKNIGDIFVKPNFKLVSKKFKSKKISLPENELFYDENGEDITTYEQLFNHSDKIIILGNPGSGKSTLVKSIICDILNRIQHFSNGEILKALPFRVELRKYLSFKKQNRGNILKYINSLIEEEYGINNITEPILNQILTENHTIIFFDGLDEIFKVQDKIEIRNDIENFHTSYSKAKSLTTSRIIGYEEARLNPEEFCELTILNFENKQIEEYLKKWYEKEEFDEVIRDREIEDFLAKKDTIDRELISNPLLLSLIVILYRNVLKLPESKLEIYQSCTKTLVDKWDAIKALDIDLDSNIYKNKEKIFADLAYWQYEQLSGDEVNITYDKALKTVSNILEKKLKLADEFTADDLAQNFMEYALKRSIYFDNNFTHKTFLEYYTAYWIFSNIEKKNNTERRNEIILKYINNPFWHIVIELLINMIDNDQADNEIIDGIFEKFLLEPRAFPFAISTVYGYKNVSNEICVKTIYKAIHFIIENYVKGDGDIGKVTLQTTIYDSIGSVYNNVEKSRKVIIDILIDILKENRSYASLVFSFYFEIDYLGERDIYDIELVENSSLKSSIDTDQYLYISYIYITSGSYPERSYIEVVQKFVENFGIDSLFKSYPAVYQSYSVSGFFRYFIHNQLDEKNIISTVDNLKLLSKEGLKFSHVSSFLANNNLGYRTTVIKNLKILLEMYDNEEDVDISKILLLFIYKTFLIGPSASEFIKEYAKTSANKTYHNKIISLTNQKRLEYINNI